MDEAKLREAFEAQAKKDGRNLAKGNCGWYVAETTAVAWYAWLACAKHLEETVKDGERLDFILATFETQSLRKHKGFWFFPAHHQTECEGYRTAREAIDAAMAVRDSK